MEKIIQMIKQKEEALDSEYKQLVLATIFLGIVGLFASFFALKDVGLL